MSQPQHDPLAWFLLRLLYYAGVVTLFICIVYFGSNYFAFGKLTFISKSDFVPEIEQRCVPVVKAVKEFKRNGGTLPADGPLPDEVEARISKPLKSDTPMYVRNNQIEFWVRFHHRINYVLNSGEEGWYIWGPYVNGPMPLPPVTLGPSTTQSTGSK